MSFHLKIRELALKADRALLHAEEAGHLRLDLSAHESSAKALHRLSIQFGIQKISSALRWWQGAGSWFKTTVLFFLILFAVTNAPAYIKIVKLYRNERAKTQEETQIAQASILNADAQMSERHAETQMLSIQNTTPKKLDPLRHLSAWLWEPASFENRIEIPILEISAPIVEPKLGLDALTSQDWDSLEEQIHETLLQGVVHYPGTAEPGQKGNTVLTGHSSNLFWETSDYNTVFATLPKLKLGDEFDVIYHQNRYQYKVIDRKEVSPKEVEALSQENEGHTLTLITCTPVGTTLRRLIVTAELLE